MRFLSGLLLALLWSCQPPASVPVETIEEEDDQALASVVAMADPEASLQLVKGFHAVEQGAWRWTMGQFAATLAIPEGSADCGATLVLEFVVPDAVIDKVGTVTLTASAAGTSFEPESYSKPGNYKFEREVASDLLGGDAVTVEFALDKFLPAGEADQRELGIIATSIGLTRK